MNPLTPLFTAVLAVLSMAPARSQGIPESAQKSELSTFFIPPTRIVWSAPNGVQHADSLLKPSPGQTTLHSKKQKEALCMKMRGISFRASAA